MGIPNQTASTRIFLVPLQEETRLRTESKLDKVTGGRYSIPMVIPVPKAPSVTTTGPCTEHHFCLDLEICLADMASHTAFA
jgi:hypothetical protein